MVVATCPEDQRKAARPRTLPVTITTSPAAATTLPLQPPGATTITTTYHPTTRTGPLPTHHHQPPALRFPNPPHRSSIGSMTWRSRHAAPPLARPKASRGQASSAPVSASAPSRSSSGSGPKAASSGPRRLNGLADVAKDLPRHLQDAMTHWGPPLLRRVAEAGGQVPTQAVRVGTDCSGLEAPLLALRMLRVPHSHVFSSEIHPRKRQFIEHTFASASSRGGCRVYLDMLRRDPQTMPRCDLYVCGFPCKPFSILNRKSKGFREVQARPFTAVLKTLRTMLPPVAVLENVVGIRRYLDKVWSRLSRLRWYEVLTVRINPKDLGEPVTRDRFFILVRLDVARPNLDEQVGKLLLAGMATECCSLCCRLLPKGSRLLEPRRSGTSERASASSRGALVASTGPQPTQRQQVFSRLSPKLQAAGPTRP